MLYCFIHKTTQLPQQEPSLREAIRMVAQLGGFLGRKADKEPGSITLWRGLQRLHDLVAGYKLRPAPAEGNSKKQAVNPESDRKETGGTHKQNRSQNSCCPSV